MAEVVVPVRVGAAAADADPGRGAAAADADPGRGAAFGFDALGRAAAPADFGAADAPVVFAGDSS
ncbi:MAG: hypothetical protein ACXVR0_00455, partial [Solirubrobacteraceae bacterium]